MKAKKAKHNKMRQMSHNKLLEKQEKLRELDIENDNQRKLILKKIQKMEKKKLDHDKEKDEFYKKIKEDLDNHFVEIKNNQKLLSKEVDEIRQDVLFYENYKFNLAIKKDKLNVNKRIQSLSKTLENQKEKAQDDAVSEADLLRRHRFFLFSAVPGRPGSLYNSDPAAAAGRSTGTLSGSA